MKYLLKSLLVLVIIVSSIFSANAQFSKSTKLISVGVSAGLYGRYYHNYDLAGLSRISLPSTSLQYETGFPEDMFGDFTKYITYGVFVGFQNQHYSKDVFSNTTYNVYKNYLYIWGGVLGSFHVVPLINEHTTLNIDGNKLDLYATVRSGLIFENYTSNYDNNPYDIDVQMDVISISNNKTYLYVGPALGARYYFMEKYAVFMEIGMTNLSNLSVGLSANL